jgi:hypothetical protein
VSYFVVCTDLVLDVNLIIKLCNTEIRSDIYIFQLHLYVNFFYPESTALGRQEIENAYSHISQ